MHRWGACVLALLLVCLGGCLSGDEFRTTSLLNRQRYPHINLGPDGALIDIVLVERPLGDAFVNDEIWRSTDLQVVGLEKKAILDDNGFRIGQVIGMNPAELQKLLESERYCVAKRRQILPAGTASPIILGPTLPVCEYRIKGDTGPGDSVLEQGQCTLKLIPSLTSDGRTKLKFTPEVLHGQTMPEFQVSPQQSGWTYQNKRPTKSYEGLSWEVTLAPNQYLIVGTRFDDNLPEDESESLGNLSFIVGKGTTTMQRLLVIRTTRGGAATVAGQSSDGQSASTAAHCIGPR